MDVKYLKYFIVLMQEKNMHRAAEKLFISQQGLSRIVLNLENELHCRLFERKRFGLEATPAGLRLYETAVRIQAEMEELRRDLCDSENGKEVLTLAFGCGILQLLYPVLQDFIRTHPDTEVRYAECSDTQCLQKLLEKAADAVVFAGSPPADGYAVYPLLRREMVFVMQQSHPLNNGERISFAGLRDERLLCAGGDSPVVRMLRQKCLEEGFDPEIHSDIAEVSLCCAGAACGAGIGVVPDFIAGMMDLPELAVRKPAPGALFWDVMLVRRDDGRIRKPVEQFLRFLQGEIARR